MHREGTPSIIERIVNNDYTIIESDFFPPPDERKVKCQTCSPYYDYYEYFNELCESETFEQ